MLVQEHFCGRVHHQSWSVCKSGMHDTVYPFLLCDIGRNTDKHWQQCALPHDNLPPSAFPTLFSPVLR